jgi:long-chain acyl-CoA synthetase
MLNEQLVIVLRLESDLAETVKQDLAARNRRLPDFRRIQGYVLWDRDFPRTASLKIKRNHLAEELRNTLARESAVVAL